MSRSPAQRLDDVLEAVDAIRRYVREGGLHEGVVYDAVLLRLMQIGEAVKALPGELLAEEPHVPWAQVAGLRDRLAHRYFDTQFSVVEGTVRQDLGELEEAVRRLRSVAG